MPTVPNHKWMCPYHFCDECGKKPSVLCLTCSDSWCTQCANSNKWKGKLQTIQFTDAEYRKSKYTYVACPECQEEPLNPVRDADAITQKMTKLEQEERELKTALQKKSLSAAKSEECQKLVEICNFGSSQRMALSNKLFIIGELFGLSKLNPAKYSALSSHTRVAVCKIKQFHEDNLHILQRPLFYLSGLLDDDNDDDAEPSETENGETNGMVNGMVNGMGDADGDRVDDNCVNKNTV